MKEQEEIVELFMEKIKAIYDQREERSGPGVDAGV